MVFTLVKDSNILYFIIAKHVFSFILFFRMLKTTHKKYSENNKHCKSFYKGQFNERIVDFISFLPMPLKEIFSAKFPICYVPQSVYRYIF